MNRTLALFLAGAAAMAPLGCSKASNDSEPKLTAPKAEPSAAALKSMTIDEVETKIAAHDGKTFIFDANTKDSWIGGHVPTATWIDDENVTAAALPPAKDALLVFYCHNET